MHAKQKCDAFLPLVETLDRNPLALDVSGDISAALADVAADLLVAARWLRDENHSFARAAVSSAITELRTAADRLGVDA